MEILAPESFELLTNMTPEKFPESLEERKRRLGLACETEIALPLFKTLEEKGLLSHAVHTTEDVDRDAFKRVDFILGLDNGSHLAIQLSTSESLELWKKKIRQIVVGPGSRPYIELKDIHPRPETLSRQQRLEEVLKIPLRLDWETVDNVYKRFEKSNGQQSPFELLPRKEELAEDLLMQAVSLLRNFSSGAFYVQGYPHLVSLSKKQYEDFRQSVSKFIGKEVK